MSNKIIFQINAQYESNNATYSQTTIKFKYPYFDQNGRLLSQMKVIDIISNLMQDVLRKRSKDEKELFSQILIDSDSPNIEIDAQDDLKVVDVKVQTEAQNQKIVEEITLSQENISLKDQIMELDESQFSEMEGAIQMQKDHLKTDVHVIILKSALQCAFEHSKIDTRFEAGGALLGKFVRRANGRLDVFITGIVPALQAIRHAANVEITSSAWADIWRKIDNDPEYKDEKMWAMVGWYHTHPGYGIFFSPTDKTSHSGWFRHDGHVGLVIDPKQQMDYGFFCWDSQKKEIIKCPYSQIEVIDEEKMLAWLNGDAKIYLERLPKPEIKIIYKSGNESKDDRLDLEEGIVPGE